MQHVYPTAEFYRQSPSISESGKKGREKVAFVCKDNPKIASDLEGLVYIPWDESEAKLKIKLSQWLEQV